MSKKDNKIIVNKFGGGIMIKEFIPEALKRIQEQINKGYQPVVVVSALKGVTDKILTFYYLILEKIKENHKQNGNIENIDNLIIEFINDLNDSHQKILSQLISSQNSRENVIAHLNETLDSMKKDLEVITRFGDVNIFQDKIVSYGEKLSCILLAEYLKANGLDSESIMAEDIPIITNSKHLNADIDYDKSKNNLGKLFSDSKKIIVIPGFTGINHHGNTTTLGRGGTDTTACFIASALDACKVILWKDVPGVLSADPNIVPTAKAIEYLSYEEAEESGKVIHDKAIQYIKINKINAEVALITDPKKNTIIGPVNQDRKGAKMISFKKALSLIIVTDENMSKYGFLFKISKILNRNEVNMVLIRNTRDSLQIVIEKNNGNVNKALKELNDHNYNIKNVSVNMVSLIGLLDWKMVNTFNDALMNLCPDPQIGAFPYKNCVRLEAIVRTDEMEKVMRGFHEIFINK